MKHQHLEAGRRRQALPASIALTLLITLVLAGVGVVGEFGDARAAGPTSSTGASPLLLLKSPGWRVQNTEENRGRGSEGIYGSIEFVTGKPIPYESIKVSGPNGHQHESGMFPPAVRPASGRTHLAPRQPEGDHRLDPRLAAPPRPQGGQAASAPNHGLRRHPR